MLIPRRALSLVWLVLAGLTACSTLGPRRDNVCTLIGCESGLTVHLAAKPTGVYRVEVTATAPGQGPVYVYQCGGDVPCTQDIFFAALIVDHAFIRVITAAGMRTTEVTSVTYVPQYPNGEDCESPCEQATVTAEIPA